MCLEYDDVQALSPDHYMAQNAEAEVVTPLCATADLDRVTHEDRRRDASTTRCHIPSLPILLDSAMNS